MLQAATRRTVVQLESTQRLTMLTKLGSIASEQSCSRPTTTSSTCVDCRRRRVFGQFLFVSSILYP